MCESSGRITVYQGESSGLFPWSCEGLTGGAVDLGEENQHRDGDDDWELVFVQSLAVDRQGLGWRADAVSDGDGND